MSPKQKRALEIIRDNPGVTPRAFARLMWPDSPCWHHHTKCGPNGVTMGGGMNLAAGGYLGKLNQVGLVQCSFRLHEPGHYLTVDGKKALEEAS